MLDKTKITMIIERSNCDIQCKINANDQLKYQCLQSQDLILHINFEVILPTQMTIQVSNMGINGCVKINQMSVGPLTLSDYTLSQIFIHDNGDGQTRVGTVCTNNGKIAVDFFAPDWVQYHLSTRNQFL